VFSTLPQPPYQGPSKVIDLNASQLEFLTTPQPKNSKGKERMDNNSELRDRTSKAKIVELDEDGDPLKGDDETQESHSRDHKLQEEAVSELDLSHYWIIAFYTTFSAPCRYFEPVLARCSIA
jgi:hypothetical protein